MAEKQKNIQVQMIEVFRTWYRERFGVPIQYSSQQAYVIEFNTMKGIYNMLAGTWKAKNQGAEPNDESILGMWQRLLQYLKEKDNFCYSSLLSIHRNYNTIIAQIMRHNEKQQKAQRKTEAHTAEVQQRMDIIREMMGGQ